MSRQFFSTDVIRAMIPYADDGTAKTLERMLQTERVRELLETTRDTLKGFRRTFDPSQEEYELSANDTGSGRVFDREGMIRAVYEVSGPKERKKLDRFLMLMRMQKLMQGQNDAALHELLGKDFGKAAGFDLGKLAGMDFGKLAGMRSGPPDLGVDPGVGKAEENPDSGNREKGGRTMNDLSWMNHPAMQQIDARKLALVVEFSHEAQGKSAQELLPLLMQTRQKMSSQGLDFTEEESDLLMTILTQNMTPEEKKKIEQIRSML